MATEVLKRGEKKLTKWKWHWTYSAFKAI